MGEVIKKNAAVVDILSDLRAAYVAAKARGGAFAELAELHLAPAIALVEPVEAELAQVAASSAALVAQLDAADHDADALVAEVGDRIWNAIGRPSRDAGYEVLFPSGNAYYVHGDVTEQPARMALLVGLLRRGVHPRLPADVATACAAELEQSAARLGAAVDAAREPRTRLTLLSRTRTALARTSAIELAAFKRSLKARGLGEAEIHSVIPHRARPIAAVDAAAEGGASA